MVKRKLRRGRKDGLDRPLVKHSRGQVLVIARAGLQFAPRSNEWLRRLAKPPPQSGAGSCHLRGSFVASRSQHQPILGRSRSRRSPLKLQNMHQPQTAERIVPRQSMAQRVMRLGDVALASLLLSATLPLMMIVGIIIKLEGPGVILDKQMCTGGGRRFRMLKFRTTEYAPHLVAPPRTHRSTSFGRFLRRTRIDALPQLISVLRGDMSILGPNECRPSFLD